MKINQITENYSLGMNNNSSKYPDSQQGAIDCFTTVSIYDPEHVTKVYPDPHVEYVWAIHTNHPEHGNERHVVYLKDEDFETDDTKTDSNFTVTESTTAGSIASVSMPLSTQKRSNIGRGIYDSIKPGNLLTGNASKKKYANSLKEYTGDTFRVQVTTTSGEKFTYSVKADNKEHAKKKVWHIANKNGHDDFQVTILETVKPVTESKMKQVAVDIMNMDNGNFKKKYKMTKEQMKQRLGNPESVIQTNESVEFRSKNPLEVFLIDVKNSMISTARQFKEYSSRNTKEVPAAPDTSKFLASKSFMIDVLRDVRAGPVSRFELFLRVGSGHPLELYQEIRKYFLNRLANNIGEDLPEQFITSDGYKVIFSEKDGTNWGGFGYIIGDKVISEATLEEDDKIIAPGKGKQRKSGLHKPGEEKKLSHFKHPFKSSGIYVSDSRGNKVCECENEDVAKEVGKALNEYVKMDESSLKT